MFWINYTVLNLSKLKVMNPENKLWTYKLYIKSNFYYQNITFGLYENRKQCNLNLHTPWFKHKYKIYLKSYENLGKLKQLLVQLTFSNPMVATKM